MSLPQNKWIPTLKSKEHIRYKLMTQTIICHEIHKHMKEADKKIQSLPSHNKTINYNLRPLWLHFNFLLSHRDRIAVCYESQSFSARVSGGFFYLPILSVTNPLASEPQWPCLLIDSRLNYKPMKCNSLNMWRDLPSAGRECGLTRLHIVL